MINREQFINEIAEVVNRNSMEKAFNDTPDFILARIAVEAKEMFTRASAHRDDFHEFRTADDRKYKAICESEKKAKPVNTCKGCPLIDVCPAVQMEKQPERKREYKKPEAHNVPKEVEAMAAFFADMFPGSEIQIQRVDLKKNPPEQTPGKEPTKEPERRQTMSYEIKRTDAEINEQLNKAADGINDGSQYPGMSYEDGIQAFADWLFGDSNEKPFEE